MAVVENKCDLFTHSHTKQSHVHRVSNISWLVFSICGVAYNVLRVRGNADREHLRWKKVWKIHFNLTTKTMFLSKKKVTELVISIPLG